MKIMRCIKLCAVRLFAFLFLLVACLICFECWMYSPISSRNLPLSSAKCMTADLYTLFIFVVVEYINKKREPLPSLEAVHLITPTEKVSERCKTVLHI